MTDRTLERELGYRIRLAREAQNYGLRRLAKDAQIDPAVLSKVETGQTLYPRQTALKKLADRLRVPVEWVTYGSVPQRIVLNLAKRDTAITSANTVGTIPREVELTITMSPAYNLENPFSYKEAAWWSEEIAWLTHVLAEIEAGRPRPLRRMGLTNRPPPPPASPASSRALPPGRRRAS